MSRSWFHAKNLARRRAGARGYQFCRSRIGGRPASRTDQETPSRRRDLPSSATTVDRRVLGCLEAGGFGSVRRLRSFRRTSFSLESDKKSVRTTGHRSGIWRSTRHSITWAKLTEDSACGVRAPYSTFLCFSRLLGAFDFIAWTHYGLLRN